VFQQVFLISLFTFIIHFSETLTYSLRLSGVRLGKLAVALSLSGIILLISRTANMIQGPLTGGIIDYSKKHPDFNLVEHMRIIILSATFGTIIAILVFPSAVHIFKRIISHLEVAGSIPQLFLSTASIQKIKNARFHIRVPKLQMLSQIRLSGIPKRLIFLNIFVTAIYTIGVLAALLASTYSKEYETAASQSSGLINGLATILLALLIDPQIGLLTDKVIKGEKEQVVLTKVFVFLMITRFLGTILAQLILVPAAFWIIWIVSLVH
jgi:hypothetical protein